IRVRTGIRHREFASLIKFVRRTLGLVLKLIAGSTETGACRIAALDHEIRNYAVKDRAVIQRIARLLAAHRMRPFALSFGKFHEVRYRLWRFFLEQANDDVSL